MFNKNLPPQAPPSIRNYSASSQQPPIQHYQWRFPFLVSLLLIVILLLIWRLIDLSVFQRSFLLKQSDARAMRVISTPAYRGMITDRLGKPLAISTPMDSVWINPQLFNASWRQLVQLSKLLDMRISEIKKRAKADDDRQFVYLKRDMTPELAAKIKALAIPGLFFQREYRRYYPESDVSAHLIGFTNIDDVGQEGLELQYDKWLRGIPGKERVLKDRLGNIIAVMDVLSQPIQGRDLELSIDDRIQYLAYKNLQDAVAKFNASSGSVIVMNPKTGEILAMVNSPSYNPNTRPLIHDARFRNRAVTDVFEPGSTMKTFSVINALASGKFTPDTQIDTNPGWLSVDGHTIHDDVPDNGVLSLTQVLQKSSNIGIAKVILTLPPQQLINLLHTVGFGEVPGSGFPGEVPGILENRKKWSAIDIATISFGYGISVTALQLAKAYSIIANGGQEVPITFIKQNSPPTGQQVINPKLAAQALTMLEAVVNGIGGTGKAAQIAGYQVAGKTGTAYTAIAGGYDKRTYTSSFIGIVPASRPQFVIIVTLHGVQGDMHFGAQVAAPAFASIAGDALRIMNVPPDNFAAMPVAKN